MIIFSLELRHTSSNLLIFIGLFFNKNYYHLFYLGRRSRAVAPPHLPTLNRSVLLQQQAKRENSQRFIVIRVFQVFLNFSNTAFHCKLCICISDKQTNISPQNLTNIEDTENIVKG